MQVFRKDGTFVKEFIYMKDTLRGSTWDLYPWVDAKQTYLIMVDGGNNEMRVIRRSDGKVLSTYGKSGRQAGEFHWVHNVAVDAHGNAQTDWRLDNAKRIAALEAGLRRADADRGDSREPLFFLHHPRLTTCAVGATATRSPRPRRFAGTVLWWTDCRVTSGNVDAIVTR